MNTGYDDLHDLVGAYVLDALDDSERARFEEHLADCPECRAEAASLADASVLLAVDEVAPPPSLREELLARLETVEQLPASPEAAHADEGADTDTDTADQGTDDDQPEQRPRSDGEPRRLDGRPRRLLGPAGPPLLMAAAVLAVLMAVGAAWWRPWAEDPEATLTAAEVLAADDAVRTSQQLEAGAEATVVVSPSIGRAVIVTEGMAPAPEGKDYELWLQTPAGDLRPAGLMPDRGNATVLLDGDASAATGVGITVEPDGGSPQPTTAPIAFVTLES